MCVNAVHILQLRYTCFIARKNLSDPGGSLGDTRIGIQRLLERTIRIPHSIAFDSLGNVYVTDTNNDRVQKFTSNGTFITKWVSKGSGDGQFILPLGIDLDSFDNVYVVDQGKSDIQKFNTNGTFLKKWGGEGTKDFEKLEDIELDCAGTLYVTDKGDTRIKKIPN